MSFLRIIAVVTVLTGALTSSAVAHVTIAPSIVATGATAELTFRCPDERPDTATTQFAVQMPEDVVLTRVEVQPLPGWHSVVTTRKLTVPIHGGHGDITSVVDTITWSGGTIKPGEFTKFSIVAGPMPSGAHELAFKALQTFANGDVLRWVELRNPGESAPQHPAPVLHVQ